MKRVWWLALGAVLVRIVWLLAQGQTQITWDGAEYARSAMNLLRGHGYVGIHGTTMFVFPPLYPILIAAVSLLVGDAERAGVLISVVAGAAVVFPVYGIAARLYDERAALFAGAIAAFLPFAVDMSVLVLSDTLFIALAATAVYALVRVLDTGDWRTAVSGGALFGLAYLTRPEGLVLGVAGIAAFVVAFALRPELRREFVRAAVLFAVALAVVASPYVAFLSLHAGSLQIEAKSAINATIASGMRSGETYTQAADEIDDRLDELGPELDDDGYFNDKWVVRPKTEERISLMVTDAGRRLKDVPRKLVSREYGTPLICLAALFGLLAGPWTRRRTVFDIALLLNVAALFVSLTTVYHFWDRYAFGFTPIIAVWAGRGIALLVGFLVRSFPRFRSAPITALSAAALSLLLIALLPGLGKQWRGDVNNDEPMSERQIGTWLHAHDPNPGHILTVDDQLVYYAGGVWSMLPYVDRSDLALRYLRVKDPRYLVLDRFEAEERPYILDWLAHGVPDRHAVLVGLIGDARAPVGAVYSWNERVSSGDRISTGHREHENARTLRRS